MIPLICKQQRKRLLVKILHDRRGMKQKGKTFYSNEENTDQYITIQLHVASDNKREQRKMISKVQYNTIPISNGKKQVITRGRKEDKPMNWS